MWFQILLGCHSCLYFRCKVTAKDIHEALNPQLISNQTCKYKWMLSYVLYLNIYRIHCNVMAPREPVRIDCTVMTPYEPVRNDCTVMTPYEPVRINCSVMAP